MTKTVTSSTSTTTTTTTGVTPVVLSLRSKAIAELVGTFVFVLVGAGAAVSTQFVLGTSPGSLPQLIAVAFANGLALAVAVSATINISGGSLNPAVTLAVLLARKMSLRAAIVYIVAEIVGATLAGLTLILALPAVSGNAVHWGAPTLSPQISMFQGILLEIVMTFFLVTVIFGTAIDMRAPKIAGLAIGLTVVADVFLGGPFTGAAMNPARASGPMIASLFFDNWYVWWIGPIIGALLAAVVYIYGISRV
jgi:MIP family channel proteins